MRRCGESLSRLRKTNPVAFVAYAGMRVLSLLGLVISCLHASPLHILGDRPGVWEAEWSSSGWRVENRLDGSQTLFDPAGTPPLHPGDLQASRLELLVAIPAQGDWNLSFPTDSGVPLSVPALARVLGVDPVTGKSAVESRDSRPLATVESHVGIRILHLDLPLVKPLGEGVFRLTHRLRIRVEWTGSVSLPAGSIWPGIVDNPGGIRVRSAAARRTVAPSLALEGRIAQLEVGDDDPFSSREDGIVRLSYEALGKVMDVSGIDMSNIAVWSGAGDTLTSAVDSTATSPSLVPIPILRRDRDQDGRFGPGDEILFWAHGPNFWKRDSSSAPGWSYMIHPYAKKRRYLIRLDAPQGSVDLRSSPVGGTPIPFTAVWQPVNFGKPANRLERMDLEKYRESDIGKGWFWLVTSGNSFSLTDPSGNGLSGLVSDSGLVKLRLANSGELSHQASRLTTLSVQNGANWTRLPSFDPLQAVWTGRGVAPSASYRFGQIAGDSMAVQDCQVSYQRDLSNLDSALFPAPALGPVAIKVKAGRTCWALENGVAVRSCSVVDGVLRDSVRVWGTWFVVFGESTSGMGATPAKWTEPVESHVVRDFAAVRKADVLVVSPRRFLDVAERYSVHREAKFQLRPMNVAVVALEDLYDLWSGGMADPTAIRNAIQWSRGAWGVTHVLLLGSGHSDPRNVQGSSPESLIPQWENQQRSSDDFFAISEYPDSSFVSVYLGRVPARTLDEANAWLEKLKRFEDPTQADFGPWRNRLVIAADDMKQGNDTDDIFDHTEQAEKTAESIEAQRNWLRFEKLYLIQYPLNGLGQKPEAARDFQTLLNQGTAGVLYLGHGGADVLADENLLNVSSVERTLRNGANPFLFFAGSCTVGQNDRPSDRGLSEVLVAASQKGAYASVAATRPTTSSIGYGNQDLATNFWSQLVSGAQPGKTLGEALAKAKKLNVSNNGLYNILGDPATVPFPGGLVVAMDPVRDTLQALSRTAFSGRVTANGMAQIRMEIRSPIDSVICTGACKRKDQKFHPVSQQFLSTETPVAQGSFAVTTGLPARVPFGKQATVMVYAWDPATRRDGGVISGKKLFWGTSTLVGNDREGPEIRVRPCDSSWSGGVAFGKEARIPLPFCLEAKVSDSSGISFDQGPDEGVVFSLPGLREPWHPELRQGTDFRSASAQLVVDSTWFRPGTSYPLDLSARDLMGNLSRQRLVLIPQIPEELSLYEVFNSPNPVREGSTTAFFFKLSAAPDSNGSVDSRATASIRIHSISGKLIKVLRTELSNRSHPLPQAVWDLKDFFGKNVANGLYPFTVVLRIPDPQGKGDLERQAKGIVAISR